MSTPAAPAATPHRGLFLAFEGGEGAGKTTQIHRLADRLRALGATVVLTREPGAGKVGATIRQLLLDPTSDLDPRTEALLFAADRAQHVATVIRPALNAGHVVITDRYMDSSAAYQGSGRDLGRREILDLSMWATHGLVPDLTILLDLDPAIGTRRATTTEFGTADRFEREQAEFMQAVRAAFLQIAQADHGRYAVVDAAADPDTVTETVWEAAAATVRDHLAR